MSSTNPTSRDRNSLSTDPPNSETLPPPTNADQESHQSTENNGNSSNQSGRDSLTLSSRSENSGRLTPQQDQLQRQFVQQLSFRPGTPPNLQVLPPDTENLVPENSASAAAPPLRPSRSSSRQQLAQAASASYCAGQSQQGACGYSATVNVIPIGEHNSSGVFGNSGGIRGSIITNKSSAGGGSLLGITQRRLEYGSGKSGTKATVRERNASMLFNELMADVWFVVGPPGGATQQRIPAHSYVLSTGSTVFYAMFYGGFNKQGDISIPDVDPVAFKILLKYLYTDEVELDADTVLGTLYAAKKYLVQHLTRACIEYLETSLTWKNVCLLLAQSRLFEEEELMQRCWELIDAQAEMALQSEGFLDVDFHTLEAILGRETLNVRELIVFNSGIAWAKAECRRQAIDHEDPGNLRKVLGSLFYQIRIPAMDIKDFANGPAKSGLLDCQETTDIFLWFSADDKPNLRFVSRPRAGLSLRRCHRFQSSAYRSNQWRYRGRCDSIQFCPDKRVFVVGFGLYGSSGGSAEYRVQIELKRAGQTLAAVTKRFFSDGSSNIFPVYFDQPIQVEPDIFYTASAILDGNELSYFGQEGLPEVQMDRINFQFQCSTESTNGTGVQGGQIPEILFY